MVLLDFLRKYLSGLHLWQTELVTWAPKGPFARRAVCTRSILIPIPPNAY